MFKIKFGAQETITLILSTALSAGGFYLLTYILCFFVTSPVWLLVGLILLNVANLYYHMSNLYASLVDWLYDRVGDMLGWLNVNPFVHKLKVHYSRTKNYMKDKLSPISNLFKSFKKQKSNFVNVEILRTPEGAVIYGADFA